MRPPHATQRTTGASVQASAVLAMLGLLCFLTIVAALHVLRPELDPVSRFLSEYGIGPYRVLWTIALVALGSGSLALRTGIRRATPAVAPKAALALLVLWSCGTIVAGIFPTDPGGVPVSLPGIIHGVAASAGFLSFVVAAVMLSIGFRRDPCWRYAGRPTVLLALLALVALFAFFVAPGTLKGITERIFVLAVVAWLAYVAQCLYNMEQDGSGEREY